jgi:hypothetical protein
VYVPTGTYQVQCTVPTYRGGGGGRGVSTYLPSTFIGTRKTRVQIWGRGDVEGGGTKSCEYAAVWANFSTGALLLRWLVTVPISLVCLCSFPYLHSSYIPTPPLPALFLHSPPPTQQLLSVGTYGT